MHHTLVHRIGSGLARRWRAVRATGDGGYSTETIIVTALLAALAIIAIGIIVAKVLATANNVNTG